MYCFYHLIHNTVLLHFMISSNSQSFLILFSFNFFFKFHRNPICFSESFSSEYVQCSQSTACGATDFCSEEEKKPSILWNIRIIVSLDNFHLFRKFESTGTTYGWCFFQYYVFSVVVIVVFHNTFHFLEISFYLCCYGGKLIN